MKWKLKELWLLASSLLVVAFLFGANVWRSWGKLAADIGPQPNRAVEEKAAIRRLSSELKNIPKLTNS